MSQQLHRDWKEIIPELSPSEEQEAGERLCHPAVIKYFQRVALEAMVENAMIPVVDMADKPTLSIGHKGYIKGRISVADEIIDLALQKQRTQSKQTKSENGDR